MTHNSHVPTQGDWTMTAAVRSSRPVHNFPSGCDVDIPAPIITYPLRGNILMGSVKDKTTRRKSMGRHRPVSFRLLRFPPRCSASILRSGGSASDNLTTAIRGFPLAATSSTHSSARSDAHAFRHHKRKLRCPRNFFLHRTCYPMLYRVSNQISM